MKDSREISHSFRMAADFKEKNKRKNVYARAIDRLSLPLKLAGTRLEQIYTIIFYTISLNIYCSTLLFSRVRIENCDTSFKCI